MLTSESILTNYINSITLSKRTIVNNGPTPEDQALSYLIVNDKTFNDSQLMTLNSMMPNAVQFRICQRYALLTWWLQLDGRTVNDDECFNWIDIYCDSIDLGGTVGIQNAVTEFFLSDTIMKGTIPADLGLLTALEYVDVSYNGLTGTLPESIGQWTAMTYFNANNNKMTGTIPASIGNWSRIQVAYFDNNQFTGIMPNGICPNIRDGLLYADCVSEITCTCCSDCY
jgi:Leucine-rich repeat (LRR) protein